MTQERSPDLANFLAEIEAFLSETGMFPSHFGRDATNDTSLVTRLRRGSDVTLSTAQRVRSFMAEYRKAHGKPAKRPPSKAALLSHTKKAPPKGARGR